MIASSGLSLIASPGLLSDMNTSSSNVPDGPCMSQNTPLTRCKSEAQSNSRKSFIRFKTRKLRNAKRYLTTEI